MRTLHAVRIGGNTMSARRRLVLCLVGWVVVVGFLWSSAQAGNLEEAGIKFVRTKLLATGEITYDASWVCRGTDIKRVLIRRPHHLPHLLMNVLRLGSIQYQTEPLTRNAFEKMFPEGLQQIVAFFNGGGKSAAELDLAYDQYPDFITPDNPAEGATGITFPLTITWPAVAADAIYIDIRVNGLSAGNGLRGDATSFVLEDWLYIPGETYTVSFAAQRNLDGGINADNQVQSVTILTFTASGEKGTWDKSVENSSR
jgi:hypothetical protein